MGSADTLAETGAPGASSQTRLHHVLAPCGPQGPRDADRAAAVVAAHASESVVRGDGRRTAKLPNEHARGGRRWPDVPCWTPDGIHLRDRGGRACVSEQGPVTLS